MTPRVCGYRSGGPACKGIVRPEDATHRAPDGTKSIRRVLVCGRCGQAHGPAPALPA